MNTQSIALFFQLVFFCSCGFAQKPKTSCEENARSKEKLFVFVGERMEVKALPGIEENRNEAKFKATYKILERVCGDYKGAAITFDVVDLHVDSSFGKNKHVLLILMKDKEGKSKYELRASLYIDLFKTTDGRWAAPYATKEYTDYTSEETTAVRPEKIAFAPGTFYNIKGWTREDIDIHYPEPFYRYEQNEAIPVYGNYVPEIYQLQKDGLLTSWDIFREHGSGVVMTIDTSMAYAEDVVLIDTASTLVVEPEKYEPDLDSIKRKINNSLLADPFNETLISELIGNCRRRNDFENCELYFQNLVKKYPDSAKTYFIKAKFRQPYPSLEDTSKIEVLKQAYYLDSNYYKTSYELAICYYGLFLNWPNGYYAYNAKKWFVKATDLDTVQLPFLKYPIMQLAKYLGDVATERKYREFNYHVKTDKEGVPAGNIHNWYFPLDSFMEQRPNKTDEYEVDWIREQKRAFFVLDWFSRELLNFREPVLNWSKNDSYRFLWLKDYGPPIVIRLEKNNEKISIHWKRQRYNQQFDRYELDIEAEKPIAKEAWIEFERLLSTIDYWSMVTRDYHPPKATHEDTWILEAFINGRYKVTERSSYIYPKYQKCLEYLISLTDIIY